ncbi:hypothetical protein FIM25_12140 [Desulfobotulus mexicanus]|uniref:Cadherin domain-containing protein n=3 Tax=Desulfobotulus mexicanus TaxID=2586642 RepID=A0A5S5ME81_9BACT|nr:hypothetical protein FIM25_12140 [Desulfobotulus mexicanus]
MEPSVIRLHGASGDTIEQKLILKPDPEYPFAVTGIRATRGGDFDFSISALDTEYGYLVSTSNTKKEAGRYYDTLILDIESSIRKDIRIRVLGDIRPPEKNQH